MPVLLFGKSVIIYFGVYWIVHSRFNILDLWTQILILLYLAYKVKFQKLGFFHLSSSPFWQKAIGRGGKKPPEVGDAKARETDVLNHLWSSLWFSMVHCGSTGILAFIPTSWLRIKLRQYKHTHSCFIANKCVLQWQRLVNWKYLFWGTANC